jgi:signal transduction histidine kinase
LPFAVLQQHARALDAGRAPILPSPEVALFSYLFYYEARDGSLRYGGAPPSPEEEGRLRAALADFSPACGESQLVPIGRLRAPGVPGGDELAWSVLLQTDEQGAVRRVFGLRVDERALAKELFAPLTTQPIDCDCPGNVVPASLASAGATHRAASFVLRDAADRVVLRSEPQYEDVPAARQALSPETPFPGWTVEVSVNPAVVRPLLPYGGRGAPWPVLATMGAVVLSSGLLALVALRRDRQLWRARQDFVSNVTHELKTPLARVRLFNELLLADRQEDGEKRAHYRRVIDRECRRLTLLLDRVLDFARSERGTFRYQKAATDLREVVRDAIETVQASAEPSRVVARLDPVPAVWADAAALQQVVLNLLDNALKYSPGDRPVEITLSAEPHAVRLTVRDQGCGIPEWERERIFDAYYRVEAGDAQSTSGSGLGLALVRRAVEAHQGRIELQSEVGRGSVFSVVLPLRGEPEPRPAPVRAQA